MRCNRKAFSFVASAAVAVAVLFVPGRATALGGAEVVHNYFSDQEMTNLIGYTDVACYGPIRRWGIYPGTLEFNNYVEEHGQVYDAFDYGPCDDFPGDNPSCAVYMTIRSCTWNAAGHEVCQVSISGNNSILCPLNFGGLYW